METIKEQFVQAYMDNIKRRGAEEMLAWLERNDFFEVPASTRYHLAQPGGLAEHSLNVWRRLKEIVIRDLDGEDPFSLENSVSRKYRETAAITALLHDVCKADVYHRETKYRENPETGELEPYKGYDFRDPFPLGHGEKSMYLIMCYMQLNQEEALAIRWHMGEYDSAVKGEPRQWDEAMKMSPWVSWLHEADMCAAQSEKSGAAK